MQTGACGGVSFIVLDQPSTSCGPCEGAFDRPPPGQQHEARPGLGQFDDFKGDAAFLCGFGHLLAGIALVDISERDILASGLLDGLSKATDLGAVIDIGGRDMQGRQMAQCIDRQM